MQALMAVSANGNQVRVVIVALLAAQLFVIDLEISNRRLGIASRHGAVSVFGAVHNTGD
jgi:hypothetical protein